MSHQNPVTDDDRVEPVDQTRSAIGTATARQTTEHERPVYDLVEIPHPDECPGCGGDEFNVKSRTDYVNGVRFGETPFYQCRDCNHVIAPHDDASPVDDEAVMKPA